MKKFFLFFFLMLTLAFIVSPAFAQDEEEGAELGTIVVTANKYEQPLDQIPNSVTVITEQDIKDQEAFTVGELLRNVPGVEVVSLGSLGEDLDIRIRGTDRDETLILIDGIKLNNPLNDRTQLTIIAPDDIERIEVLRGSQSVLYGSDAVGGVIQIFTKKGPQKKGHDYSVNFSGGNLETFRETAAARGGSDKISYSVTYTRTDQKGRFARDRYGENAVSGNAQFRFTDSSMLSINGNYWQSSQQLPTAFLWAPGAVIDPAVAPTSIYIYINNDINRHAQRHYTANKIDFTQHFTDWWESKLTYRFTYFKDRELNSNQGDVGQTTPLGLVLTPSSVLDTIRSYRHDFELQQNFFPIETEKITDIVTFGFEFEYEDVKIRGQNYPGDTPPPLGAIGPIQPSSPFPSGGEPGNRQNFAVYVQNNLSLSECFVLNAGVRVDHNTTYDTEVSPRVGVSYLIKKIGTKLKGSYSEGFHAPTVVDFYNARILGINDKLKAETSQSYDVGIEQTLFDKKVFAEFTFFYIDFDNLISATYENISDAYSWGFESAIDFHPIDMLWIGGNYTYTKAINESGGGIPLPNRARHRWHAYLTIKPIPRLTARFDVRIKSSQYESWLLVNNIGRPIGGTFVNATDPWKRTIGQYVRADFALSYDIFKKPPYKFFKQLKFHAKVNNFTNSSYEERYGFPAPGITFLAGLKSKF